MILAIRFRIGHRHAPAAGVVSRILYTSRAGLVGRYPSRSMLKIDPGHNELQSN